MGNSWAMKWLGGGTGLLGELTRIKLRFNAAEQKELCKFPEPGAVIIKLCLRKTACVLW